MLAKVIKLTTKGILLYTTILVIMLFIMGIDSIFDNNLVLEWILTIAILLILCYKLLSNEDIKILTLDKYINTLD